MPACCTYHRVSTSDQNETLARDELERAAAARGFDIALAVEETGSGARNDRPGLAQVLDAARRGKVSAVLVYKLDRFGRSALDLLANIEALNKAGVRFIAVTQGMDIGAGGDPMSKLMLTMLAGVAEFERDLIRERTRLGLKAARERGVKLGSRYRPGPSVEEARTVKAKGLSWPEVAAALGCSVKVARERAAGRGPS